MGDKVTAFVSHSDCARHDTGWGHADHQGRLPAVMRAVYRDMIDLHEPLLDLEGRRAEDADLLRYHSTNHLAQVREWVEQARERGKVIEPVEGLRISDATWDATRASVGSVLTAIDAVLAGDVRNAFCATRPAGSDARPDAAGRHGLINPIATGVRYLVEVRNMEPVMVLDWRPAGIGEPPIADIPGGDIVELGDDLDRGLHSAQGRPAPAFVILVADFTPPGGANGRTPQDVYDATSQIRSFAEECCDGRLVSVLDHGYSDDLGPAVVQHLRALIGLPPQD